MKDKQPVPAQVRMEVPDLTASKNVKTTIQAAQISKVFNGFIVRIDGFMTGMSGFPQGAQQPTTEVRVFEAKVDLEDYLKRLLDEL